MFYLLLISYLLNKIESQIWVWRLLNVQVHVYDLNVSKYESLCEQQIGKRKKSKLTHISFNPKQPVILVGNERFEMQNLLNLLNLLILGALQSIFVSTNDFLDFAIEFITANLLCRSCYNSLI